MYTEECDWIKHFYIALDDTQDFESFSDDNDNMMVKEFKKGERWLINTEIFED